MRNLKATAAQGGGIPPPPPPTSPPVVPQIQQVPSVVDGNPVTQPVSMTPPLLPFAPQPVAAPLQPMSQGATPNQGISAVSLDALRPIVPGAAPSSQSINPLTGLGYGFDPPTPMLTPGMASQGTPSQRFSISTPPHPQQQQGAGGMLSARTNPLAVDPLSLADPWGQGQMTSFTSAWSGRASTIGSAGPPAQALPVSVRLPHQVQESEQDFLLEFRHSPLQ
eukprot:270793-Amphidinium_carterae.2